MDSSCRLNGEGEGLKLKFDFIASDLWGGVPKYAQVIFGSN